MSTAGLNLRELRTFGKLTDAKRVPILEAGGFIVPGDESFPGRNTRRKENPDVEGQGEGSEAGSAARSRQGRRTPSAARARAQAPPVRDGLRALLNLEELWRYYPGTRILRSSSRFLLFSIPAGLFHSLPYRARVFLEVPINGSHLPPCGANALWQVHRGLVPDARAWAVWKDGLFPVAYHKFPDLSICAFMPGEWRLGRDPLRTYVHSCVLWLGKVLHLQFFDRWPGPQHCPPSVRVRRDKPGEYCGCGSDRRWRACCMEEDRGRTAFDLLAEELAGAHQYLAELKGRDWPPTPPWRRRS